MHTFCCGVNCSSRGADVFRPGVVLEFELELRAFRLFVAGEAKPIANRDRCFDMMMKGSTPARGCRRQIRTRRFL